MSNWTIGKDEAAKLCTESKPDEGQLATRNHLIELFNEFENLAIAYEQYVVDRKAFEDSFVPVITDMNWFFNPFIDKILDISRSDPWPAKSRVVRVWTSEMRRGSAQKRAHEESDKWKQAIAEQKLRGKTDDLA